MNDLCWPTSNGSSPLWLLLLRAAHTVEALIESSLAPSGLSIAKLSVLGNLVQANRPLSLGQLAGLVSCVKSNMTQLIDRLETDGLVGRVPDPADRRSVLAVITDEGKRRYELGISALEAREKELIGGFSAAEREQLAQLLRRVTTKS
jgi:DNA-binding MarR family transcriptional regulator